MRYPKSTRSIFSLPDNTQLIKNTMQIPLHTRSVPKYNSQYPNPIRPEVEHPYPLGPEHNVCMRILKWFNSRLTHPNSMAEGEQDCSVAMLVARAASGSTGRRARKRAGHCALCKQPEPEPTTRKEPFSVHSIRCALCIRG